MPRRSYVRLMSSGSSSHEVACFSVDRTKYLMLSKSMPDSSEPHRGIGFFVEGAERPQADVEHPPGSSFFAEMSRTTASESPRCALAPAVSESAQP